MTSSYSRKCKHCGRTIQLRKMPGGQWVAFEGYDTVHDCKKPVARRQQYSDLKKQSDNKGDYDDLGFDDFLLNQSNVPNQNSVEADKTSKPHPNLVKRSYKQAIKKDIYSHKKSKKQNYYIWPGLLIIFLVILAVFSSNNKSTPSSEVISKTAKATRTSNPTSIPIKPTLSADSILATQEASCLPWHKVSKSYDEKEICIYGDIVKIYNTKEAATRIKFSDEPNTFFLIDLDNVYPELKIGDCVQARGVVQMQSNIPFIKVKIITECTSGSS